MAHYCNYCKRESEVDRNLGALRHELGLFNRAVGQDHRLILNRLEKLMSEIENLKAAVVQAMQDIADEQTELKAAIDKVAALASQPTISPADVQALADQLNAVHQSAVDAVAAAKSALGQ